MNLFLVINLLDLRLQTKWIILDQIIRFFDGLPDRWSFVVAFTVVHYPP
jgi:hypothetical protein